jgi:hypothetical protein
MDRPALRPVNSMKYILSILLYFAFANNAYAQVYGCTDPQASNFNANATNNDGSCLYASRSYSPPLRAVLTEALREISGIIYFKGKILALNDGGGGNLLYMLDTSNGNIVQTITLEGATNIDWEDIAQDSGYVYVGDIGNNVDGNRKDLCIYKIARAAFDHSGNFTIPATSIQKIFFSYADQTNFSATGPNNTRFDCESLLIRRDRIHLFTKNWVGSHCVHYSLPVDSGTHVAQRLDSLNTSSILITGADIGGDDEILFTGYSELGSCAMYLVYGFDSTEYFFKTGNKRRIQLPSTLTSGQLEAVCFVNATHGFTANEYLTQGFINVSNRLRFFAVSQFIIDYYENNPRYFEAVQGMLRYNSTTDAYEIYTGILWENLGE